MKKPAPCTVHPRDFQVNQTLSAYRINQAPLLAEGQAIDLFVLQDAASPILFGSAFAPHGDDFSHLMDDERAVAVDEAVRAVAPPILARS
jgi:hypothetical protein